MYKYVDLQTDLLLLILCYSNRTVYACMMLLSGMYIVLVIVYIGPVEFRLQQVFQVIFQV